MGIEKPGAETLHLARLSDCELFWERHVPRMLAGGRDTTLESIHGRALFRILGPGGGSWTVTMDRGVVAGVENVPCPDPRVTISLGEETFLGIVRGTVDHRQAFFLGDVTLDGDVPFVLWVSNLIPLLREKFPFDAARLRREIA
jgi:hypothetical protein